MKTPFSIELVNPATHVMARDDGRAQLHRHDHPQLLVAVTGGGVHHIDGEVHNVEPPWAMLVARGKLHMFLPAPDTLGWCIYFDEAFLPMEANWLFSPFFELSNIRLGDGMLLEQVSSLCRLLHLSSQGPEGCASPVLPHLLSALLQVLQTELQARAMANRPHRASDFAIFCRFMRHLEDHFALRREVRFYTHLLRVTSKRLEAVCRALLDKTPQAVILERSMLEAKRRLLQTGESIQQVGFGLGYEDPSHFSKVFRNVMGKTPREFRRSSQSFDT